MSFQKIDCNCESNWCPTYNNCAFLPTSYVLSDEEQINILYVGQGGGTTERKLKFPFCGLSGKRLMDLTALVMKSTSESIGFGFTNIIRDCPYNNRLPIKEEIDACKHILDDDINTLKIKGLNAIVVLGNCVKQYMIGPIDQKLQSMTMKNAHGMIVQYNGLAYMPTYHPSSMIRQNQNFNPYNLCMYEKCFIGDLQTLISYILANKYDGINNEEIKFL